jgi:hypothetical protein
MKLANKLKQLRASAPKGPSQHGQLYATADARKRSYKRVTLHTLFISEENTHLLRPHVFEKAEALTPAQWADWFATNLHTVHVNAVLPGLAIRTSKSWAVERIIGWTGQSDVKHKSDNSPIRRTRHKTKSSRK